MDSEMLADMLETIEEQDYDVDSVSVIRNGYIVVDATLYPFEPGSRHIIYSCTKSIVSALVGIAIDEGYIEGVDQPVLDLFPERTAANLDANKEFRNSVDSRVLVNLRRYWYFVLTIFISAFLLFQIQPLVGKYVSPWFGGGSAVWTTCMLFFQLFLLGGYTYAHLINKLNLRTQGKLHAIIILSSLVLVISLFFVWETPVTPDSSWKPPSSEFPIWYVLRLLMVGVGLPFFLLATTSSLIQVWFSQIYRITPFAQVGCIPDMDLRVQKMAPSH